jgi:hypothetical protein
MLNRGLFVPQVQSDSSQHDIREDIKNELGTVGGNEPPNYPI